MIEYSNEYNKLNLMFFSEDGSWGSADDIVIIDTAEIDSHFVQVMEELSDSKRPDFMRWFVQNQTHDQLEGDYSACEICERWENGTEDEIISDLESED